MSNALLLSKNNLRVFWCKLAPLIHPPSFRQYLQARQLT